LKEPAVNNYIEAERVILIDETGNRLGEFLKRDAITLASGKGLDLVQVASGDIPICKILDHGRLKYQQSKKEKANKRKSASIKTKKIEMNSSIDPRDLEIKANKARKILKSGARVQVIVKFRGREMSHTDIGKDKCKKFQELCGDLSDVEKPPKLEGRNISMLLVPKEQ